jgi:hypothetical protein
VAEWSNVPDSKSGVLQGTVGSNPTLSASNNIQAHDSVGFFVSTAASTIKSTINYQLG